MILRTTSTTDSPVLTTRFRTPAGPLHSLATPVHFSSARNLPVHKLHGELTYPADAARNTRLRALARRDVA